MFAIIGHPVGPGEVLMVAYLINEMQVRGVDAQRVMAAMIQLQAVWDRAV